MKGFLEALLAGLRRLDPGVEVYLAGSWARGDWLLDSDVDLIVVSRRFEGLSLGERLRVRGSPTSPRSSSGLGVGAWSCRI